MPDEKPDRRRMSLYVLMTVEEVPRAELYNEDRVMLTAGEDYAQAMGPFIVRRYRPSHPEDEPQIELIDAHGRCHNIHSLDPNVIFWRPAADLPRDTGPVTDPQILNRGANGR